jgi:glycyl-tRNA synthetase beta chain
MSEATLLVELLTEELPPKSLKELSEDFASKLSSELGKDRFLASGSAATAWATPRRLAVSLTLVNDRSPDAERDVQGPPVSAAAQAVSGFAKKNGVAVEALKKQKGPRGEIYIAHVVVKGVLLADALAAKVEAALKSLPIPKVMRWGSGDAQFVRPVHGLVMLHGKNTIPGSVLGLESGNRTRGHRFMGKTYIALASADAYEKTLLNEGKVIADFEKRKAEIDRQLKKQGGNLGEYQTLLDEVTALVEHPSVYVGEFEKKYLEVPAECLVLTMRQNQKYFPLFDAGGKLTGKFLIVSNMQVADPKNIIGGNERVVRPRLEDARFFYEQDKKQRLEARVPGLAKVVYHNKLGSQLDRVNRLQSLARQFAGLLKGEHVWGADENKAKTAAYLAKADLVTGMVGEFPELQGIMGAHYARNDGLDSEVAQAIQDHYLPRFSGDRLPSSITGVVVALVDKLDALFGMLGTDQIPTGEKDPFALRRQALGVVRLIVEKKLPLNLEVLFRACASELHGRIKDGVSDNVYEFLLDRLRTYLRDQSFSVHEIEAVLSQAPNRLDKIPDLLAAVRAFMALPEAQSLAAANKRIRNIIHKSDPPSRDLFSTDNLREAAERSLYDAFKKVDKDVAGHAAAGRYKDALLSLAALKEPVDAFFDGVMVNVDDQTLRNNRLLLLMNLDSAMNRVADISKLAT